MNPEKANKTVAKRRSKYDIHGQTFIQHLREQQFNNRYSLTDRKQQYDALNDPYTSYYFSNPSVKMHLKTFRKAIRHEPNQQQKKRISQLISRRITEKYKDFLCPKTLVYQQELTPLQIDTLVKKSTQNLKPKKSRKSFVSYSSNQQTDNKISLPKKRYFPTVKQEIIAQFGKSGSQNASLQLQNYHKSVQKDKVIQTKKERLIKHNDETLTQKHKKNTQSIDLNIKTHTEQNLQKHLIMKSTLKDLQQRAYADKLAQQLHRKKHQKWLMFLSQKKHLLAQAKPSLPQKQEKLAETVIT